MAALRWSIAVDEPEIGARIARGAWWSWFVRGRIAEGREWIDWALATEALPERSQLDLLYASACYAQTIGDYDRVAVLDGLLLEGCQALGDDDRAAKAYACRLEAPRGQPGTTTSLETNSSNRSSWRDEPPTRAGTRRRAWRNSAASWSTSATTTPPTRR